MLDEVIHHLAVFISRLWQIHVFAEGNTRTTAVFFIKYLKTLGFNATNDIFAENAWYFRNALVRANYNDLKNGVHETTEFLELFLKNLLLDEKNELHNRAMHISGRFIVSEKQDIEELKQDIEGTKQDIDLKTVLSKKTTCNIHKLYEVFGCEIVFGRQDVMLLLNITASPASELIRKMLQAKIIIPVKGKGKGKYLFEKRNP